MFFTVDYKEKFNRTRLIEDDDYYPFDLADVVRFVENRDTDGKRICCAE